MAVLRRNKGMILGLNDDLLSLTNANTTEKNRAEGEETRIESLVQTEVQARKDEVQRVEGLVTAEASARDTADGLIKGRLNVIEGLDSVDGSIAKSLKDAKAYTDSEILLAAGDVTSLTTLVNTINGTSLIEGSFRKAISDLVGTAPEALDTLKEIADSLNNDPNLAGTLTALVSSSITSAKVEIKGEVSSAFDTLAEVEVALNKINGIDTVEGSLAKVLKDAKAFTTSEISSLNDAINIELAKNIKVASNLSDLENIETARTNLSVYSKAEIDASLLSAGAINQTELLTVSGNDIVLSFKPKNGMIYNFGTVRYVDELTVAWDIPITNNATDISGKTYTLNGDSSLQFDTKSVMVQYQYTAV